MTTKHEFPLDSPGPHVPQDVAFQERDWRAQVVGQWLVGAFLVAGVLGVFGGGVLGQETAVDPTGELRIEHPRFARLESSYDIAIVVAPAWTQTGTVELWIGADFLNTLTVEGVTPEPEREEIRDHRVVFTFRVASPAPATPVVFHCKPRQWGRATGQAGVVGGPTAELFHFVHP